MLDIVYVKKKEKKEKNIFLDKKELFISYVVWKVIFFTEWKKKVSIMIFGVFSKQYTFTNTVHSKSSIFSPSYRKKKTKSEYQYMKYID